MEKNTLKITNKENLIIKITDKEYLIIKGRAREVWLNEHKPASVALLEELHAYLVQQSITPNFTIEIKSKD